MGEKYNSKSVKSIRKKIRAEVINDRNSYLMQNADKLKKEIFKIESGRIKLSDREQKVISKIADALRFLDYELVRKDETIVLYKKRELENSLRLIEANKRLLHENI